MRALALMAIFVTVGQASAKDGDARPNIEAAAAGIEGATGEKPLMFWQRFGSTEAPPGTGDGLCNNENSCVLYAARHVQVQAVGSIVQALTSSQVSPATYHAICAGIFVGMSRGGIHPELAAQAVDRTFREAAVNGRGEISFGSIELTVRPDLGGKLLECTVSRAR